MPAWLGRPDGSTELESTSQPKRSKGRDCPHILEYPMRNLRLVMVTTAFTALAACSDDTGFPLPLFDVGGDAADAGGDVGGDTSSDAPLDTGGEDTGGEDTGGEDTGGEDTGGEDTGGEDTGCLDADGDTVCDDEDVCPDGDDTVDSDEDGVPDDCDVCPDADDTVDDDEDGVPDDCDVCPGSDDAVDTDEDGVPDDCDICEGDDTVDADEDGVPDDCDACPDSDDTVDDDEDGVPDGCDACPGSDDAVDTDEDGVPDDCDACPGVDDAECVRACADDIGSLEAFGEGVVGCAGSVLWDERDTLCGEGHYAATALEWIDARGEAAPSFHYWTDDDLTWQFGDATGDCSTDYAGSDHTGACPGGPMRVCTGLPRGDGSSIDVADPFGNTCTWVGCGWQENSPNEFFGGCNTISGDEPGTGTGAVAGTLCVARDLTLYEVAKDPEPPAAGSPRAGYMRGNVYLAETDAVLYGFEQRHESEETCTVDVYVWSSLSADEPDWTVLYADQVVDVEPGISFVGATSLHLPIQAGTYYAMGLGWECTARNAYNSVEGRTSVGFGINVDYFVADNSYDGFAADYVPAATDGFSDTYPQDVWVYGVPVEE